MRFVTGISGTAEAQTEQRVTKKKAKPKADSLKIKYIMSKAVQWTGVIFM